MSKINSEPTQNENLHDPLMRTDGGRTAANKKPVIGITLRYEKEHSIATLKEPYIHILEKTGAIPIPLPEVESQENIDAIVSLCDGILFSGGGDLDPKYYGEEAEPELGSLEPERDVYEFKLWEAAKRQNKPVLGICRGCQFINVALGGTLYQHIPCHKGGVSHMVAVYKGNELHDVLGDVFTSNSFHHQAIKRPADGVRIIARAADGIIEAFDVPDAGRFIMGVQWHPEKTFKANGEKKSADIVRLFVEKCAK